MKYLPWALLVALAAMVAIKATTADDPGDPRVVAVNYEPTTDYIKGGHWSPLPSDATVETVIIRQRPGGAPALAAWSPACPDVIGDLGTTCEDDPSGTTYTFVTTFRDAAGSPTSYSRVTTKP
jgi:hypothetical protein